MFDIFPNMIKEHFDDLRSGELHKGNFIGMYMEQVKKLDIDSHEEIQLKYPQFVSNDRTNRDNNWLDFILNMNDNDAEEFKRSLWV